MQLPIPLGSYSVCARMSSPVNARTANRSQQTTALGRDNDGTAKAPLTREPAPRKRQRQPQIRLLIADDHALILEGLAATIGRQNDMVVVAQASNGREAVDLWQRHRPDITLLDLRMPGGNGVGALREIRDHDAAARVIVHTTFDTDEEIYQAVCAGAKAYLLKDAPLCDLLNCIREVHAGGTCIPPALAARLAARMSNKQMTHREIDVLRYLAAGRSNKEIGSSLFISETTVKPRAQHLREAQCPQPHRGDRRRKPPRLHPALKLPRPAESRQH